MPRVQIEPLPADLWFNRIKRIAEGQLGDLESALRHAFHLLQMAPLPLREHISSFTEEDEYEALLEAGEYDAASRFLIAKPTGLSISEQEPQTYVASIRCEFLGRVIRGRGRSIAHAVLNAWVTCLLTIESEIEGAHPTNISAPRLN